MGRLDQNETYLHDVVARANDYLCAVIREGRMYFSRKSHLMSMRPQLKAAAQ